VERDEADPTRPRYGTDCLATITQSLDKQSVQSA
jgi:hypothetical protein